MLTLAGGQGIPVNVFDLQQSLLGRVLKEATLCVLILLSLQDPEITPGFTHFYGATVTHKAVLHSLSFPYISVSLHPSVSASTHLGNMCHLLF